ncbi:MAG: serine hydrolase [bacterium]|nr:serine hydrolase [bacterium]
MMFFTKKKLILVFCFLVLLLAGLSFYYFLVKGQDNFLKKTTQNVLNLSSLSQIVPVPQRKEEKSQNKVFLADFTSLRDILKENKADFIEANLEEMKITLYQKGEKQKEADILKRGDEYSWGGTASGIYQVNSGYEIAFSAIAEVYMPYAMNFYGKYYLHGEPYYPSGAKMISEASGGCLQIKDDIAKEFFEKAELKMPFLVIDKKNDNFSYPKAETTTPAITSNSFLVADLGTGEVLLEQNSQEQKQIASITKLMTAIVVSENVDLRKKIVVQDYMLNQGFGETESIKTGDYLDVVDLLHPLLIESSNDAAEVSAGFLGRNRTIDLMNEKAKAILMPNTNFTCPSGYATSNVSTARDLFYLARYVLNNRPLLFDISKSKEVPNFGKANFDLSVLWNKNVFSEDETFVGGKTGYIKTSGYNGLFVFKFTTKEGEERNIVFILLGTPHLDEVKSNTQKLYIWVQKNYF